MQALDGIEVIDLGQIYNGAYCSLMLSYLGANVTKVEPPFGEPLRGRVEEGEPPELVMLNSTKDGITLDLTSERGKELFTDLVRDADVLVENFAPGTMEKFGLSYDTLQEVNPELVYAHGSGFGEDGPKSDRLAMDLIVQGVGGVMDVTGFPDGPPTKTGVAIGDFLGGIHLAAGVLAALVQRGRTGEGQFVEASMYDALFPAQLSQLAAQYKDRDIPSRTGNRHGGLAKCPYSAYETTDGYVVILCASDEHWKTLTEVMDRPDLYADPELETNVGRLERMDDVDDAIAAWTAERERRAIEDTLVEAGVPCAAVQTIEEVLHDPHLEARDTVVELDHPGFGDTIRVPGAPIRLSESDQPDITPSPTKGEDNHDVYAEKLGLSRAEIEQLEADGVI